MNAIVIAGVPRSGTTWIGECLSQSPEALYVHEPDSEWARPFAVRAKRLVGPYPVLSPGDVAVEFERLWSGLLEEKRRMHVPMLYRLQGSLAYRISGTVDPSSVRTALTYPRTGMPLRVRLAAAISPPPFAVSTHVIVKSVLLPMALEWLSWRFRPTIVVVLRHPLNVLASWKDLNWRMERRLDLDPVVVDRFVSPWRLPLPDPTATALERAAWQLGILMSALSIAARRHPDWTVVAHEDLCAEPVGEFRRLYERLGLPWTSKVADYLHESNRPGRGFETARLASEQTAARWRTRLNRDEIQRASNILESFSPIRRLWDMTWGTNAASKP